MQVIILAGGKGTRLSAQYPDLPKALVSIAGKPFLQWQLAWLRRQDVSAVHLATGYRGDQIQAWLESHSQPDLVITSSHEPAPRGTAGGLKFVESFIREDPVIVVNGDTLLPNANTRTIMENHRRTGADLTMAVVSIRSPGRYGTVVFKPAGQITVFLEKANRTSGYVNGGVYVINRSVLALIPAGCEQSLETDIFPRLAAAGGLFAAPTQPPLLDMGTPDGLRDLNEFLTRQGK